MNKFWFGVVIGAAVTIALGLRWLSEYAGPKYIDPPQDRRYSVYDDPHNFH